MISVIVGTFGDPLWKEKAHRALSSVRAQTVKPASVHAIHGVSLDQARNQGAEWALGEWLLFLDADDTIRPEFLEAMSQTVSSIGDRNVLLQPSHVCNIDTPIGKAGVVSMIPPTDIMLGNYLIIRTLVRRETFLRVGGFRDLEMYEDWDLWIRCVRDGAEVIQVPEAVYEITFSTGSRNEPSEAEKRRVADSIRSRYRFS